MSIKEKIEEYLAQDNGKYLEIFLTNGAVNIASLNGGQFGAEIDAQDDGMEVIKHTEDGCTYKTYIPYSNVAYFNLVYDCPQTMDGD